MRIDQQPQFCWTAGSGCKNPLGQSCNGGCGCGHRTTDRCAGVDRLIKHSFAPFVDEHTRLLILGSLPGEESLKQQRYYAFPGNQLWRLVGGVIERDLVSLEYEARLQALRDAGIGLWDVIGSAKREGSLDAAIREHQPNALRELVAELPNLRAVGFNGGTSARLGRKILEGCGPALVSLPSSSPAYAAMPFEAKLEQWSALRPFLDIRG